MVGHLLLAVADCWPALALAARPPRYPWSGFSDLGLWPITTAAGQPSPLRRARSHYRRSGLGVRARRAAEVVRTRCRHNNRREDASMDRTRGDDQNGRAVHEPILESNTRWSCPFRARPRSAASCRWPAGSYLNETLSIYIVPTQAAKFGG